jgi:uncharacterized membrane protein
MIKEDTHRSDGKFNIGHVLAPWPFVVFGILGIAGCIVTFPQLGPNRGGMLSFDAAAIVFLLSCVPLFHYDAERMRRATEQNDANRSVLLLIAAAVTTVIMIAVEHLLSQKGQPRAWDVFLVVVTLGLCWLFSTVIYALHYAHLFYVRSSEGKDSGGLKFPETPDPDYWDFSIFPLVWQ